MELVLFGGIALSIATSIAIIAMAFSFSRLNRTTQYAALQQAAMSSTPYWALLAEHPHLYPVLRGEDALDELAPADKIRAEAAWIHLMNSYQSQYALAAGDLSTQHVTFALKDDLRSPAVQQLWEVHGHRYHMGMRIWVATALAEIEAGR